MTFTTFDQLPDSDLVPTLKHLDVYYQLVSESAQAIFLDPTTQKVVVTDQFPLTDRVTLDRRYAIKPAGSPRLRLIDETGNVVGIHHRANLCKILAYLSH